MMLGRTEHYLDGLVVLYLASQSPSEDGAKPPTPFYRERPPCWTLRLAQLVGER
jgi:hypothetical protein